MKKYLLTVAMIFVMSISSYSQVFELFGAKDAYEAVMNEFPGLSEESELVQALAIEFPGTQGLEINFESGLSSMWNFAFKSKDIQDQTLYIFIVMKINGEYMIQFEEETEEVNAQEMTSVNPNWEDSKSLAAVYANTQIMTFYNDVKETYTNIQLILMDDQTTNTSVWVVAVTVGDDYGVCIFDAESLSNIGCQFPVSVNEELALNTKIYPIPAIDNINLELPFSGDVVIEIYNLNGEKMITQKLNTDGKLSLPVANFANGIYNLVVNGNGAIYSKRVVIAK